MKPNLLRNLERNELVADGDKDAVRKLVSVASTISFGKIDRYNDGYIRGDYKSPRVSNILQMDGCKAAALMEWAKRQVSGRIEAILLESVRASRQLDEAEVHRLCLEGLADPDKQRDDAAGVGTKTHDDIEVFLTESDGRDDSRRYSESVQRFAVAWKASGLTCIGTEIPVMWHNADGQGFGGRLDILAYKDGKFYIGDNKTSRSVHDSYGIQVSSYAKAVEQMSEGAIKIAGGYIFHIPNMETMNEKQKKEYNKRGSLIELRNLDDAFEHFKLLLGLYYRRNSKYF